MATSIRFKVGMTVLINSDVTGCGAGDKVTRFGYEKGDRVELIRYDSSDETWRVKKADTSSIWIKRRNLAPLLPPFKIGDRVVLINKDAAYAKSDNVTTDKEYIVKECSYISIHSNSNYIKVTGNGAEGTFWIETAAFKLSSLVAEPTPNATEPKTMKAVCIEPGSLRLTIGNTYDVQEAEPVGDDMFFKVLNPDGRGGPFNCWQSRFKVITETKTPTPVEPKKRMAVCIDMSESPADYQVGMTYEITRESADYFYLNNKPGGMYKWRFKEIVEPIVTAVQTPAPTPFKVGDLVRLVRFESAIYDTDYFMKQDNLTIGELYEVRDIGNNSQYPDSTFIELKDKTYSHPIDCFELAQYTIKVVCNDNSGYEGRLTIGKTYMAKPSPSNNGEEETARHLYDIESNDKGTSLTTARCRRFTVVTPPKVGDTLSAEWLNNSTPKSYYGLSMYSQRWGRDANRYFHGDRKIERIESKEGVMAALISDTIGVWIAVDDIVSQPIKHTIPDIAKEVPAPVMGEFLAELTTLIQKYK